MTTRPDSERTDRRTAAEVETFVHGLLRTIGADDEVATEVAGHVARAELSGHGTHGLARLPGYVESFEGGVLHPSARPTLVRTHGTTAVFDAHRGFGHFSTRVALEWTMSAARENGSACAAIRHSFHIGRLGDYAERAARDGMIAMVTVGLAGPGDGVVAPFNGKKSFLGTNPWSFGFPAAHGTPMIFDAATSAIAGGLIRRAADEGFPLPPGALVDAEGNPTTDASAYFNGGTMQPLGGDAFGHKGFGFGLASAFLGGLAMIDDPRPVMPMAEVVSPPLGRGSISGVFVLTIDPGAFGPAARYGELVADTLEAVRNEPAAPHANAVQVPGDPSARARARHGRDGIEVAIPLRDKLNQIASRLGSSPLGG